MSTHYFTLTAQDAWFFRDGRPYNHQESNQTDVESLFPPPARTLTGALRAALARANGWSGTGRWKEELNRCFGAGPDDLGLLQFTGPFLIRNAPEGKSEALWPMPRHVLGKSERNSKLDEKDWVPVAFLVPDGRTVKTDDGERNLPRIATEAKPDGLKPGDDMWITTEGLTKILGGAYPKEAIIPANRLWRFESRVGLKRGETSHNVDEGDLYSPAYVRLCRNVAMGVGVNGVPKEMKQPLELFPLGGESRLACCEKWDGDPIPVSLPRDAFVVQEGRVHFATVLLTPGRFENGAPNFAGAQIVSACVGKPQFMGGWDSLKREPLPLEPFAPAGSVWFCTATREDFDGIHKMHGQHVGAHTAQGFGQILIGLWPPTLTNRL
jgi:CRISPR-associated protein Cmr3